MDVHIHVHVPYEMMVVNHFSLPPPPLLPPGVYNCIFIQHMNVAYYCLVQELEEKDEDENEGKDEEEQEDEEHEEDKDEDKEEQEEEAEEEEEEEEELEQNWILN